MTEGGIAVNRELKFVIITGLSGAGKSQAIKVLEDDGYFCVDNLPPALLPTFVDLCARTAERISRVAIVMDLRGGEFFKDLFEALGYLDAHRWPYEVLFLEASDETLIRRFKETRRRHLLAGDGSIADALAKERELLSEFRARADIILDTSDLTLARFKEELEALLLQSDLDDALVVRLVSFGFKRGIPLDADFVFDCRFLPNPHYVPDLRGMTGADRQVQEYVFRASESGRYLDMIHEMLEFAIPLCIAEGKVQLIVGIGCTGGRHRSVAMVEKLKELLMGSSHRVVMEHRDISWVG